MESQLRHFIVKYLNQTASEQELDELSRWIKNPVNAKEFKSLVHIDYAIGNIMEDFNTEQEKRDFLWKIRKIKQQKKVRKLWIRVSGAAASILIIISLSVLPRYLKYSFESSGFDQRTLYPLHAALQCNW